MKTDDFVCEYKWIAEDINKNITLEPDDASPIGLRFMDDYTVTIANMIRDYDCIPTRVEGEKLTGVIVEGKEVCLPWRAKLFAVGTKVYTLMGAEMSDSATYRVTPL